ncbi:MAG: hypothetical protein ACLFN5_06605, partial [bacterium]
MNLFESEKVAKLAAVISVFLFVVTFFPHQAFAWRSEDGRLSASGFVEFYYQEHSEEEGSLTEISPLVVNFQWEPTDRVNVLWEIEANHAPRTQHEHFFGDKKVVEGDVDFVKRLFIDYDLENAGNIRAGKSYRELGYWISTDWTYYSPTYNRPNIPEFGLTVPTPLGISYYDNYDINRDMSLNYNLAVYRPGWNNTNRVFKDKDEEENDIPEGELGESYLLSADLDLFRNYNIGAAYYHVKDRSEDIDFDKGEYSTEFHSLGLDWLQFYGRADNLLDGNLTLRAEYAVIETNMEEDDSVMKDFDEVTHRSFYADAEYRLNHRWSVYARYGTGDDLPRGFSTWMPTAPPPLNGDDEFKDLGLDEYTAAIRWLPSPGLQVRLEHSRFDWDVKEA